MLYKVLDAIDAQANSSRMNQPASKLQESPRTFVPIHDRAIDNIRFIRETMERSASFTNVSGLGGLAMGLVAIGASIVAAGTGTDFAWLVTWLTAAALSFSVAIIAMAQKSRANGVTLFTGPARKFTWNILAPLVAGGVLTIALARAGAMNLLPGMWLLLYGTSIVTGGSYSVRPVPLMGLTFMLTGVCTFLSPSAWGDIYMAAGFGGLHILFGTVIWRKHGG
ncbi:uncharacterized protein METZ01_LOCUS279589 [marine metagenome]|uniref:Uncharacterized protein n=1 Tax=marine metagenome TaxID=408172 RepID=A0A382KT34_9ZZZZ